MRPKDPIPVNQKSGIIYRIDCLCVQANYVGEIGKRVLKRMHQHELAVRRKYKHAAHASTPGHSIDFERVRILGWSDDQTSRQLQEAWHSRADSINRHIELPDAYLALREQIEGRSQFQQNRVKYTVSCTFFIL
ncbi:unnamed protein product [Dibothriocephalus latus]|uniref:GIY-YIG domain-containing protein n=1 Tax=Dibothriocephalus latus TaxID=60516 RepID=A0A3P7NQ38_DIBLA|nr:unnamed protein product [Dibothriocephalus latus]